MVRWICLFVWLFCLSFCSISHFLPLVSMLIFVLYLFLTEVCVKIPESSNSKETFQVMLPDCEPRGTSCLRNVVGGCSQGCMRLKTKVGKCCNSTCFLGGISSCQAAVVMVWLLPSGDKLFTQSGCVPRYSDSNCFSLRQNLRTSFGLECVAFLEKC